VVVVAALLVTMAMVLQAEMRLPVAQAEQGVMAM
jgi:hypothetical protein